MAPPSRSHLEYNIFVMFLMQCKLQWQIHANCFHSFSTWFQYGTTPLDVANSHTVYTPFSGSFFAQYFEYVHLPLTLCFASDTSALNWSYTPNPVVGWRSLEVTWITVSHKHTMVTNCTEDWSEIWSEAMVWHHTALLIPTNWNLISVTNSSTVNSPDGWNVQFVFRLFRRTWFASVIIKCLSGLNVQNSLVEKWLQAEKYFCLGRPWQWNDTKGLQLQPQQDPVQFSLNDTTKHFDASYQMGSSRGNTGPFLLCIKPE